MKRLLDQDTLRAMARGCAVLGAGGGGDTYYALLQALQAAEDFGPATLVDVDDLPGDSLIMPCGGIGAPLVALEKIEAGDEGERLRDLMQRHTGRTVTALMAGEIGGGNGLVPVTWAAPMGLPVVDADGMGRRLPPGPPGHHGAGRPPGCGRRVYARLGGHRGPATGRGTADPAGAAERAPGRARAWPAAGLGARPDHDAGQRDRRRDLGRSGQLRPAGGGDRVR